MSFGRFALVRTIRLYPLLIMGGLLGGLGWIVAGKSGFGIYFGTLCAMLGIPTPFPVSVGEDSLRQPFPINGPTWSLFFEMMINALYAAIAPFLSARLLFGLIGCSLAWLIYAAISASTLSHLGVYYDLLWGGVPRTAFSFFMGVAVFRLGTLGQIPSIRVPPLTLVVAVILVFAPFPHGGPESVYYDLACVIFVFPAIIALGYQNAPSGRLVTLAALSGALSYPIYLLHSPFYTGYEALARLPPHTSIVAALVAVPLLAFVMLKIYDEPIRAWLWQVLQPKQLKRVREGRE